jgi:hypothetical protein
VKEPDAEPGGDGELDEPRRRILDTIGMLDIRGIEATREVVARWMGIHPNGGRYCSNLAQLKRDGYLDGMSLTERGALAMRTMETGIAGAKAVISDTQARLLDLCTEWTGEPLTRERAAAALGIHPNGGRYCSDIARLRVLGLLSPRGTLDVAEALFR